MDIQTEEDIINKLLQSAEDYKEASKPVLQSIKNQENTFKDISIRAMEQILSGGNQSNAYQPINFLMSAKMAQDFITKNTKFVENQIADQILPHLVTSAQFNQESQDDNRGQQYFNNPSNDKELSKYSNSFLRIVLEAIWCWARTPQITNLKFQQAYESLEAMKVKFPDDFKFFQKIDYEGQYVPSTTSNSSPAPGPSVVSSTSKPQEQKSNLKTPEETQNSNTKLPNANSQTPGNNHSIEQLLHDVEQQKQQIYQILANFPQDMIIQELGEIDKNLTQVEGEIQNFMFSPEFDQEDNQKIQQVMDEMEFCVKFKEDLMKAEQASLSVPEFKEQYLKLTDPSLQLKKQILIESQIQKEEVKQSIPPAKPANVSDAQNDPKTVPSTLKQQIPQKPAPLSNTQNEQPNPPIVNNDKPVSTNTEKHIVQSEYVPQSTSATNPDMQKSAPQPPKNQAMTSSTVSNGANASAASFQNVFDQTDNYKIAPKQSVGGSSHDNSSKIIKARNTKDIYDEARDKERENVIKNLNSENETLKKQIYDLQERLQQRSPEKIPENNSSRDSPRSQMQQKDMIIQSLTSQITQMKEIIDRNNDQQGEFQHKINFYERELNKSQAISEEIRNELNTHRQREYSQIDELNRLKNENFSLKKELDSMNKFSQNNSQSKVLDNTQEFKSLPSELSRNIRSGHSPNSNNLDYIDKQPGGQIFQPPRKIDTKELREPSLDQNLNLQSSIASQPQNHPFLQQSVSQKQFIRLSQIDSANSPVFLNQQEDKPRPPEIQNFMIDKSPSSSQPLTSTKNNTHSIFDTNVIDARKLQIQQDVFLDFPHNNQKLDHNSPMRFKLEENAKQNQQDPGQTSSNNNHYFNDVEYMSPIQKNQYNNVEEFAQIENQEYEKKLFESEIEEIKRDDDQASVVSIQSYQELLFPFDQNNYKLHASKNVPVTKQSYTNDQYVKFQGTYFKSIVESTEKLNRFQLACCKNQSILYEDRYVQVGVLGNDIPIEAISSNNKDQRLSYKLSIYFQNISNTPLYVSLSQAPQTNHRLVIQQAEIGSIAPGSQLQSDISLELTDIPCLPCTLIMKINNQISIPLIMPIMINRYFWNIPLKVIEFKDLFKTAKQKLHIEIPAWNEQMIKYAHDFRKHIVNLIELTNSEKEFEFMSGKGQFQMGMAFKLDSAHIFTLRFTVHTDKSTLVTICYDSQHLKDQAEFILNTIYFLFAKQ